MERHTRILLLAATSVVTLVLTALPALAASSGSSGGEGTTKLTFPTTPHDRVGLAITGIVVIALAVALYNAVEHLRGHR